MPPPPPTPLPVPRSGSDVNASGDGSFGGRSSRDEDPLDPSLPLPRSQLGPKLPINLVHHHRHSTNPTTTTPAPPESLPLRRMLCSPRILHSRRMQLSREASGCGGSSHHRHHHYLQRILPPSTPPTTSPTAAAEIATIRKYPPGVAIAAVSRQSYYSWGSGRVTEGGAWRRYRKGRRQA